VVIVVMKIVSGIMAGEGMPCSVWVVAEENWANDQSIWGRMAECKLLNHEWHSLPRLQFAFQVFRGVIPKGRVFTSAPRDLAHESCSIEIPLSA
jgi:hypothetical protein